MKITTKTQMYKTTLLRAISGGLFSAFAVTVTVANGVFADAKSEITNGIRATGQGGGKSLQDSIADITGVLLFIVGTIAVIAIIIGGIKYTTSNGDQGAITSAKNTIMYAVIGLVVAIMAYAIVSWVTGVFG